MTAIVKVGGKSQGTPELVERFVEQVCGKFPSEPVVWVFSAIGDTTDRLDRMLQSGSEEPESFNYLHKRFIEDDNDAAKLYEETLGSLRTFYAAYRRMPVPSNRAALLTYGERMAAILGAAAIRKVRRRGALFLDYHDTKFPVVASGGNTNYLSAAFDVAQSAERANSVLQVLRESDVVIPGFGGVSGGAIKTLGRGGSDESAFGCGNILRADSIYICTDVNGIKQAVFEGDTNGRQPETVEEIDIEEAMAGAFLGAKLPSYQALAPLEDSYRKGHVPDVFIANSTDLSGPKTRIAPSLPGDGVKFVADRDIPLYAFLSGDRRNLLQFEIYMVEKGLDYLSIRSGTRAEIGTFGKGSDISAEEFKAHCEAFGITCRIEADRSIVGVVGSGIKNMLGVDANLYEVLRSSGINVLSSHDYNDSSTGSILRKRDRNRAVRALYEKFSP